MSSRVRALTQPTVSNLKTWQQFGNVKRRKPCKTVRQGAGKYQANQQDSDLSPDSGSAYRGSNPCLPANLFNQSDTPRKAGGLMSGAASKAVTQVHRLSPCGVLGGRPQEKLSDLLQCASFKGLRLTAVQQLRLLPLLSSIEIGEVAIKGSKATVKPLRVSLVEPVAYLLCSYKCQLGVLTRPGKISLRGRLSTFMNVLLHSSRF